MPNVVLSPHNAGQTPEVVRDGLLAAVKNVEHYLAGRPTDVVVAPVR
jgi:phosphoglycerate dehydrogenase-like enzyme